MPVDTFKTLAQGQLGSSTGVLYTAPRAAIIRSIFIANGSGSDRTASLTINGSAAANQILPPTTILAGGFACYDGVITLGAGETISGVASAASAITYTFTGDEVS